MQGIEWFEHSIDGDTAVFADDDGIASYLVRATSEYIIEIYIFLSPLCLDDSLFQYYPYSRRASTHVRITRPIRLTPPS